MAVVIHSTRATYTLWAAARRIPEQVAPRRVGTGASQSSVGVKGGWIGGIPAVGSAPGRVTIRCRFAGQKSLADSPVARLSGSTWPHLFEGNDSMVCIFASKPIHEIHSRSILKKTYERSRCSVGFSWFSPGPRVHGQARASLASQLPWSARSH